MATLPRIDGVHRVRKQLAGGKRVRYHYTCRGGARFWTEPDDGVDPVKYSDAYKAARAAAPATSSSSIRQLVISFLASGEFKRLADRTRADYRLWAERFAERFGSAPAVLLEDRRFRGDVAAWRDQWSHSPKQAQYAWTVAKRIASWAADRGVIGPHVITGGTSIYKADRAEIIWPQSEINKYDAAPLWVRRILVTALSTGLGPAELCALSRPHVAGDVIQIRRAKTGRLAVIPIIADMRRVLEETPADQLLILTSQRGRPLTPHRASEGVRQWGDKLGVNPDLRLYDTRGTAATRLVRANVRFDQVAQIMGWSLRYAQNVVERYVALDPNGAAEVVRLLEGTNQERDSVNRAVNRRCSGELRY